MAANSPCAPWTEVPLALEGVDRQRHGDSAGQSKRLQDHLHFVESDYGQKQRHTLIADLVWIRNRI